MFIKRVILSLALVVTLLVPAQAQYYGIPSLNNPPGLHQGIPGVLNMELLYGSDSTDGKQSGKESQTADATPSTFARVLIYIGIFLLSAVALLLALLAIALVFSGPEKRKATDQSKVDDSK